jgi:hypothetical protein
VFDRRILKKKLNFTSGETNVLECMIKQELDEQIREIKDFGSEVVVKLSRNQAWFRRWKIINSEDDGLEKGLFRQAISLGVLFLSVILELLTHEKWYWPFRKELNNGQDQRLNKEIVSFINI